MKYLLLVLLIVSPAVVSAECITVDNPDGTISTTCDGQVRPAPEPEGKIIVNSYDVAFVPMSDNPQDCGKYVVTISATNSGGKCGAYFRLKQVDGNGFETEAIHLGHTDDSIFEEGETKTITVTVYGRHVPNADKNAEWSLDTSTVSGVIAPAPKGNVAVESFEIAYIPSKYTRRQQSLPAAYSVKVTAKNSGRQGTVQFVLKKAGSDVVLMRFGDFFAQDEERTVTGHGPANEVPETVNPSDWVIAAQKL